MSGHRHRTYATADAVLSALLVGGVEDVIVSPGSRSTPLALTVGMKEGLRAHVVLDERAAGFVALGMAKAAERPVAMVCTSGSAVAHYLPAMVEADRSRTCLVAITADRPSGFLEADAPQTIDQIGIFGTHVRAAVSLDVAHACDPDAIHEEVGEALSTGQGPRRGPVHVNVPFDKPLEPEPGWRPGPAPVPVALARSREAAGPSVSAVEELIGRHPRGVIVAGPRPGSRQERQAIARVAEAAGWPIVADPLSGFRRDPSAAVITGGELMLRSPSFVDRSMPDAMIRLGGMPTGRATLEWLAGFEGEQVVVDPDGRWTAPTRALILRDDPEALFASIAAVASDSDWFDAWRSTEREVLKRRAEERAAHPRTELAVCAEVARAVEGRPMWAASSMPIRHFDVILDAPASFPLYSNRGANGIDGTIASATGAALTTGEPVSVLLGDLAYLHDCGSLVAATELGVDLTLVVLDNGGGAIFSMLPIAGQPDLPFEEYFTTPHSRDLVAIGQGFGARARSVEAADVGREVAASLGSGTVDVLVVETSRDEMFAAYDRLIPR